MDIWNWNFLNLTSLTAIHIFEFLWHWIQKNTSIISQVAAIEVSIYENYWNNLCLKWKIIENASQWLKSWNKIWPYCQQTRRKNCRPNFEILSYSRNDFNLMVFDYSIINKKNHRIRILWWFLMIFLKKFLKPYVSGNVKLFLGALRIHERWHLERGTWNRKGIFFSFHYAPPKSSPWSHLYYRIGFQIRSKKWLNTLEYHYSKSKLWFRRC